MARNEYDSESTLLITDAAGSRNVYVHDVNGQNEISIYGDPTSSPSPVGTGRAFVISQNAAGANLNVYGSRTLGINRTTGNVVLGSTGATTTFQGATTLYSTLSMQANEIKSTAVPTSANHITNKLYVDNALSGVQGPQGPSNVSGSQGTQGPQGASGPTGNQGTQGALGAQGVQGMMVYTRAYGGAYSTFNQSTKYVTAANSIVIFATTMPIEGLQYNSGTGVFTLPNIGTYLIQAYVCEVATTPTKQNNFLAVIPLFAWVSSTPPPMWPWPTNPTLPFLRRWVAPVGTPWTR